MRSIVREILGEDGPVAAHLGASSEGGFEARPEQLEMAEEVNRTLATQGRLLVEAGTGVGKSYAYLVPAILRAICNKERVVVATNTIALQEQLLRKDIPTLAETIQAWGIDHKAAVKLNPVLVKGRGNYVSIRRLRKASEKQNVIFNDAAEKRSLHVIEDWAQETLDGSLSTLPALERFGVWDRVQSDTDNCMGRKCPTYQACFYQQSRRLLEMGNLFVCNHAVFFADLKLREIGAGFLPEYQHVILDEAHNLEDVASDHFGLSLTEGRVEHFLNVLYNAHNGRGFLPQLSGMLTSGDASELIAKAVLGVHETQAVSRAFFEGWLHLSRQGALPNGRIPEGMMVEAPLANELKLLSLRLKNLRDAVKNDEDRLELQAYANRAEAMAFDGEVLVGQKQSGCVYWLEGGETEAQTGRQRGRTRLKIACSPIDVAPEMKKRLFDQKIGVVLTSATLATTVGGKGNSPGGRASSPVLGVEKGTGGDARPPSGIKETHTSGPNKDGFDHCRKRLGCEDARALQLGSPFDYATQCKIVIDLTVADPRSSGVTGKPHKGGFKARSAAPPVSFKEYTQSLSRRIGEHVRATEGGAFVLFTSFAVLNAVADSLGPVMAAAGYPLLVQGRDGPPGQVLEKFRADQRSVLLGAASFWQGVDVRGQNLRNVIITKLPFDPPDRPLVEARNERIKALGGDPFREESLPRALLRFRQGFGRLIRSKTDTGRVVIMDPRVVSTAYGKLFMAALPAGIPTEMIHLPALEEEDVRVEMEDIL